METTSTLILRPFDLTACVTPFVMYTGLGLTIALERLAPRARHQLLQRAIATLQVYHGPVHH